MGERLVRGSPWTASVPGRHRVVEGRNVHHLDRVQREVELFRDRHEPDDLPHQGAARGAEGCREERQLLDERDHADALGRRLRRRRLPRPVLHRRLLHHRLPPGFDGSGDVAAGAEAEARALAAPARDALLRGHLPCLRGHGRAQAGAGELRSRPVRREPRVGARPEDVLLQLVELRALRGRPPGRHRHRLRAGARRLGRRQRRARRRHGRLARRLPRRLEVLPVQGVGGQPADAAAAGGRRRAEEEAPAAAGRRRRAVRGEAAEYQEAAALPYGPAQVPGQGCHSGGARRGARAVASGDGDAGGGDEAGAGHGAHLGCHASVRHGGGAGVHLLHQAGQRDGPPPGPALRAPSGLRLRALRARHDRHRRALRQGAGPLPPPRHGRRARAQHPQAHRRRHGRGRGGHGRRRARGAPPPPLAGAGRRARGLARPAVRAHGRRRRVRARGAPGVLLRPGPRQHAQPGHRDLPQCRRRRQLPQQPRHHGGGQGQLARRTRQLVRQGPQPQQARPLLLGARVRRRRQPRLLHGRRRKVLVQDGQGRRTRRRRQDRRRRRRVRRRRHRILASDPSSWRVSRYSINVSSCRSISARTELANVVCL